MGVEVMIPMFALAGFGVLLGAPFIRRTEFVAFFRMLALTGVLRFSVLIFRTVLPSRFFLFFTPHFGRIAVSFLFPGLLPFLFLLFLLVSFLLFLLFFLFFFLLFLSFFIYRLLIFLTTSFLLRPLILSEIAGSRWGVQTNSGFPLILLLELLDSFLFLLFLFFFDRGDFFGLILFLY